jgi:hypothetical protein
VSQGYASQRRVVVISQPVPCTALPAAAFPGDQRILQETGKGDIMYQWMRLKTGVYDWVEIYRAP